MENTSFCSMIFPLKPLFIRDFPLPRLIARGWVLSLYGIPKCIFFLPLTPLALHISASKPRMRGILCHIFARHSEMILQHWKKEVWGPRYSARSHGTWWTRTEEIKMALYIRVGKHWFYYIYSHLDMSLWLKLRYFGKCIQLQFRGIKWGELEWRIRECPEISVNINQRGLSFLCHGAPAKRTWFQRSALSMASFTLARRFQWSRFTFVIGTGSLT